jgi:hypothetical protein
MGDHQFDIRDLIIAWRGGHPDACEFCLKPYTDTRWPEPEEGGAWACNECYERWAKEDASHG